MYPVMVAGNNCVSFFLAKWNKKSKKT